MLENGKILFLQHNSNTNAHIMHTCLEYSIENQIDYILFQEPWFAKDNITTISHYAYYCIVPEYQNIRPRVVIFARKQSRYQFCLRSDICSDSDLLVIDIIDKTKSFTETIQLINIYNEKSLLENNNERTIERCLHTITPAKYTIICGDMNAHHSWWNSKITNSIRASELVNWLEKYDFELLNESDILTCSRSNNSIIDLTFAIKELNNMLINWEISEDKVTGSDHETILFSVNIDSDNLVENPVYNNQYNFEKADWKIFAEELILQSNKELKLLRKELANAKKQYKKNQNQTTQQAFQALKSDYFYKIKQAKATCWNDFLENAVGKEIFKAFNYTKFNRIEKLPIIQYQHENQEITAITFEQKCEAFMQVLFKKPPQSEAVNWNNYIEKDWEWPVISRDEIKEAIFSSSIRKAAGPDKISFLILQKAFENIENRFVILYSNLISYGYHPICWREAIGAILKKPNRKASLSKSYRVISLLNSMAKTAEKIIASRLAT